MRHNLNALIKDEIVKRFENVVKDEIKSHNISIESTNREICYLKELFEDMKKLQEDIIKTNNSSLQSLKEMFLINNIEIEEKYKCQDSLLKKCITSLNKEIEKLNINYSEFVKNNEFEKFKETLKEKLNSIHLLVHEKNKETKKEICELFSINRVDLNSEVASIKKNMEDLECLVKKFEDKLSINIVDSSGISRSIKVDQKTMFIMEKKIENLYTMIHRLEKRIA